MLLKGSCNNCVPARVAFLVLAGLTCRGGRSCCLSAVILFVPFASLKVTHKPGFVKGFSAGGCSIHRFGSRVFLF